MSVRPTIDDHAAQTLVGTVFDMLVQTPGGPYDGLGGGADFYSAVAEEFETYGFRGEHG